VGAARIRESYEPVYSVWNRGVLAERRRPHSDERPALGRRPGGAGMAERATVTVTDRPTSTWRPRHGGDRLDERAAPARAKSARR